MRSLNRFWLLLLLVAVLAIGLGIDRWYQGRRAYYLARSTAHNKAWRAYELALADERRGVTPSWVSPGPLDQSLRAEYERLATEHRHAAILYQKSATWFWIPLPDSPPDLPDKGGSVPVP